MQDHIKHYLIWAMISEDIAELIGSEDPDQISGLILKMIENTRCRWNTIVLAYSYVEAESLRSVN